jgi:hybrid cluster-associated redox disulfide protein
MVKIDKKISFTELIEKYPESIEVLMEAGMHCIGCPMSSGESIEEGIVAHGLDVDEMIKKIETRIGEK